MLTYAFTLFIRYFFLQILKTIILALIFWCPDNIFINDIFKKHAKIKWNSKLVQFYITNHTNDKVDFLTPLLKIKYVNEKSLILKLSNPSLNDFWDKVNTKMNKHGVQIIQIVWKVVNISHISFVYSDYLQSIEMLFHVNNNCFFLISLFKTFVRNFVNGQGSNMYWLMTFIWN